jgi:homoserine dehydrogenase
MLRFEGAVAGAIPIVRTLGEALAGDDVYAVAGVVNGTCASILGAMEGGAAYDEALAEAQRAGYAEADPLNDVSGIDAAHKLALIAQLAFDLAVISPRIRRMGIAGVTQREVARARARGLRIRLVAATVRTQHGILAEVAPVLVTHDHAFAQTAGAENVVVVVARDAGSLVLRGAGAGGPGTASAVLGDVVSVLRALGERRDLGLRGDAAALEPAIEVAPFYATLGRVADPPYALWSDAAIGLRAPCTNELLPSAL